MLGYLAWRGWGDYCGKAGNNADTEKEVKREDADY